MRARPAPSQTIRVHRRLPDDGSASRGGVQGRRSARSSCRFRMPSSLLTGPVPMLISIAIEGPDADLALADFLATEGISGSALPAAPGEAGRDGGVRAVGAVTGI